MRARGVAHLLVPACLSGLMLLAFFPLIFGLGTPVYQAAAGRAPPSYLARWLLISAALFAISAGIYVVRRARERSARKRDRSDS